MSSPRTVSDKPGVSRTSRAMWKPYSLSACRLGGKAVTKQIFIVARAQKSRIERVSQAKKSTQARRAHPPCSCPHSAPKSGTAPPPHAESVPSRSEEHTSELQSQSNLVCRLLLEKKNTP